MNDLSNPVISLSKTMNSFNSDQLVEEKDLDLPKTNIKEVEKINESYVAMVQK